MLARFLTYFLASTPPRFMAQQFGKFKIAQSQIFYQSSLCVAFVNIKPIVDGHVLVIPKRSSVRLNELTSEETSDLFNTVRIVQEKIELQLGASASNIAIQDGKDAGQSVPHCHVHILPRSASSLEVVKGDEIYSELESWAPRTPSPQEAKPRLAVADDAARVSRSAAEMEAEAKIFRKLFL